MSDVLLEADPTIRFGPEDFQPGTPTGESFSITCLEDSEDPAYSGMRGVLLIVRDENGVELLREVCLEQEQPR